jgi:hypothetical protein
MQMNRLVTASIALIIVGISMTAIYYAVYVPKLLAYKDAIMTWAESHNAAATPPLPKTYGLNQTATIISTIIGTTANILVFLGAAYFIIVLIRKIAKRLGT